MMRGDVRGSRQTLRTAPVRLSHLPLIYALSVRTEMGSPTAANHPNRRVIGVPWSGGAYTAGRRYLGRWISEGEDTDATLNIEF